MKNHKMKRGVTLVEIAIVLVIIGLLLGGVLKGQELINNAKVRSIADRQNSLKVAWFSFIDRYQALPGDYVRAAQNIAGATNVAAIPVTYGNGTISETESVLVMQQLTGAGYLRCPQCTYNTDYVGELSSARNSLQNQYGGIMSIWHDGSHYSTTGGPNARTRLMIHTGPLIPSNIISEVDRKLDDGIANTGDFVFNNYNPNAGIGALIPDTDGGCVATPGTLAGAAAVALANESTALTAAVPADWRWATDTPPVVNNCGASVTI